MPDTKIKIAGKTYSLRYRLPQRYDIEQFVGVEGQALFNIMVSGKIRDQAVVVWAGLKGAKPETKITPRGVVDLFQAHNDKGGDFYQDIYCVAAILACESGLLGVDAPVEDLKRLLNYREPEGKDEDAAPAAIPAGE